MRVAWSGRAQFQGGRGSPPQWAISGHWNGRMTGRMSCDGSHGKRFNKKVMLTDSARCVWSRMEELIVICKVWTSLGSSSSQPSIKIFHFVIKELELYQFKLCIPAISKCGIQTSSTSSTQELVRNAHSWTPPRPTELETLGMGATTCVLTRATGDTTEWLSLSHYHYPADYHTGWNLRITDLFQKHLLSIHCVPGSGDTKIKT